MTIDEAREALAHGCKGTGELWDGKRSCAVGDLALRLGWIPQEGFGTELVLRWLVSIGLSEKGGLVPLSLLISANDSRHTVKARRVAVLDVFDRLIAARTRK